MKKTFLSSVRINFLSTFLEEEKKCSVSYDCEQYQPTTMSKLHSYTKRQASMIQDSGLFPFLQLIILPFTGKMREQKFANFLHFPRLHQVQGIMKLFHFLDCYFKKIRAQIEKKLISTSFKAFFLPFVSLNKTQEKYSFLSSFHAFLHSTTTRYSLVDIH